MLDLIIIGAGPAGITAAVYAARKRMDLVVIAPDIGGQAAWSSDVENYTGYQFISGTELVSKFEEHMRSYNLQVREGEKALEVEKSKDSVLVKTDKGTYEARTVIVASGKKSRQLGVPGEDEFRGKGTTYCATCDGPLFSGKDVAVIGGGNSGLDAALQLIKIARHVYMINSAPALAGDVVMREKVQASNIVTVLNNAKITRIIGDKFVTGLNIDRDGKEEHLKVEGIFVEIGLIPNSDLVKDIARNERGEIKVNNRNETNIPAIFAAGDVTDVPEKQIIIAAGEGAKAALSAFRYLSQHK